MIVIKCHGTVGGRESQFSRSKCSHMAASIHCLLAMEVDNTRIKEIT